MAFPRTIRPTAQAAGRGDRARPAGGFTLLEMLMSLSILALLMTSIATAMKGTVQGYTSNTAATDLARAGVITTDRVTRIVRTAYDADSATGSLTVYSDATGANGTVFRLVNGTLVQVPLSGGVEEQATTLIGDDGEITVASFAIVRQENALSKTVSVTIYLRLTGGGTAYECTTSAGIRKNQGY